VHYIAIITLEYDAMGRVIKETKVNTFNDSGPLGSYPTPTYTYDSRGNLAVAGWKSSAMIIKLILSGKVRNSSLSTAITV
jgi:hypothetical protein